MKSTRLIIMMLFFPLCTWSQRSIQFGAELDVLPYATGGYFGAGWAGNEHWHLRALYADVNMPAFIVPKAFSDLHISSVAVLVDYFQHGRENGFWVGSGPVFWSGHISDQSHITQSFNAYLLNGSLGYVFNFGNHLYASPWGGMSLRIAGDQKVTVGAEIFHPRVINPEMSLKFGYRF